MSAAIARARSSSSSVTFTTTAKMFGSLFGGGPPAPRTTQAQLVDHLVDQRLIVTPRIADAFRHVDRKNYLHADAASPEAAYEDRPLPIGSGQTISAPHMHAMCTEALADVLVPGARVLDVGSGSGFWAAVAAKLVGSDGFVLGVEKEPDLAARSLYSISRANPELLFSTGRDNGGHGNGGHEQQPMGAGAEDALSPSASAGAGHRDRHQPQRAGVKIVHGNVLDPRGPLLDEPPFDAIHVGAAADELHEALLAALKPGGRMAIPLGPRYGTQVLTIVDKDKEGGRVRSRAVTACTYVPLTKPGEMNDGVTAAEARRFARLVRAQEREDEMGGGGSAGALTEREEEERRRRDRECDRGSRGHAHRRPNEDRDEM